MNKQIREGTLFHHSLLKLSNGRVKKWIEPNCPFSSLEQEALMKDILEFRERLHSAGVPIAGDYTLSIQEGVIVEETVNCGEDGYKQITDAASNAERVLCQIVRALRPILLEPEITMVPDPHPANWCFDEKGVGRYVDFQPARFRRNNGLKIVGFPQPTGKEYEWSVGRYYSKAGLIRILRFNAMRAGGFRTRNLLLSVMRKEWPGNLFEEVTTELSNLLEEKVRRKSVSLREALQHCDEWKIDDIRELAMIVAEQMTFGSATFLNRVLECTRADFNLSPIVRRRGVQSAKRLIRESSEI
jgi:hypothetical protein